MYICVYVCVSEYVCVCVHTHIYLFLYMKQRARGNEDKQNAGHFILLRIKSQKYIIKNNSILCGSVPPPIKNYTENSRGFK